MFVTAGAAQSPFCFVFATMLSCQAVVGGAFPGSATHAVQRSFFDVASTRAEPLLTGPQPRFELIEIPAAAPQPKMAVPPGATERDVATGSLNAAPPANPNTSTPT